MDKITTKEVIDKLDMFQSRFGKIDEFGWWYLVRISADADTQFTSIEFIETCQTRKVHLILAATEYQEINGQAKVTRRMLRTMSHSLMVHARVSKACINFAFMYMTYNIFWY